MAGQHHDHTVHRITSGETPEVGLRVLTNNLDWGTITEVSTTEGCGWYCNAWHRVTLDIGGTTIMNCERLATVMPKGF